MYTEEITGKYTQQLQQGVSSLKDIWVGNSYTFLIFPQISIFFFLHFLIFVLILALRVGKALPTLLNWKIALTSLPTWNCTD